MFGSNNDDWFENYGPLPTDRRHTLNVSGFFTLPWQVLRLSKAFELGRRPLRIIVFADVFNLFNTANLVQYGSNLAETASFGQPGGRSSPVFGSGGPRAVQFGGKVSF